MSGRKLERHLAAFIDRRVQQNFAAALPTLAVAVKDNILPVVREVATTAGTSAATEVVDSRVGGMTAAIAQLQAESAQRDAKQDEFFKFMRESDARREEADKRRDLHLEQIAARQQ